MKELYSEVLKEVGINAELIEAPPKVHNTNIFTWWRRWGTHPYLKRTAKAIDKAKNGDFDFSPYWKQAQYEYWYLAEEILESRNKIGKVFSEEREIIKSVNKRISKLLNDAALDDVARISDLIDSIRRDYGGSKELSKKYIEEFEGEETIEEAIIKYPDWLNENRNIQNNITK